MNDGERERDAARVEEHGVVRDVDRLSVEAKLGDALGTGFDRDIAAIMAVVMVGKLPTTHEAFADGFVLAAKEPDESEDDDSRAERVRCDAER